LDRIPGALEYIVSLRPHDFQRLENPTLRRYMAPRISLGRVAAIAGIPVEELLARLVELSGGTVAADALVEDSMAAKSPLIPPEWMREVDTERIHRVDVLPIDEAHGDPIPPINTAVRRMSPGSVLMIRHRWEPQPLYDIWQKMGIEWFSEQASADEWHVFVHKPESFPRPDPLSSVMVDLRNLPGAEGPARAIAMFEQLPCGNYLELWGTPGQLPAVSKAFEERAAGEYLWQVRCESDAKVEVSVIRSRNKSGAGETG